MKTTTLVLIEWVDIALYNTGWIPQENVIDNMEFIRCISVGFIVAETDERVVLTQTRGDNAKITNPLVIPRKVIKRIRKLK